MPDELRWKPDDVRDVLTEYLPVVAPGTEEDYAMVPEVWRAFIRFCHDEEDLPRPVTRVALQAVDRRRPDYLAAQHDPVGDAEAERLPEGTPLCRAGGL